MKVEYRVLKKIVCFLSPFRKKIAISFFLSLTNAALCIVLPFLSKLLIDNGMISLNLANIVKYSCCITCIGIVIQVFSFLQSRIHIKIQKDLSQSLGYTIFRHLLRLKSDYFDTKDSFELINEIETDVDEITQMANEQFLEVIVNLIKMLGACGGLFFINPILSSVVFIFMIIRYAVAEYLSSKRRSAFEKDFRLCQDMAFWYSDTINGLRTIKLWNLYKEKETEFVKIKSELLSSHQKISEIFVKETFFSSTLDELLTFALYFLAGILLIKEKISFGEFFSFIAYSQIAIQPVYMLVGFKFKILQLVPKLKNFEDYLQLSEESNPDTVRFDIKAVESIEFLNITWQVENRAILKNINLKFNAGQKIAFIGHNGAGKSTLIDLMLRLKEPTSGQILINGEDIQSWDLNEYRRLFSIIEQEGFLFNSTVEQNIFLGDSKQEFLDNTDWAVKQLERLESGLSSKTGSRAALLSGGEKQKIFLLRALQKRYAKILILDEATSNYDMASEHKFDHLISSLTNYDMIFVITHRIEILKSMDVIVLLNNGKVEKVGNWNSLKAEIETLNKEIIGGK